MVCHFAFALIYKPALLLIYIFRIHSIFNGNENFLQRMSFLRMQESPVYKGDS